MLDNGASCDAPLFIFGNRDLIPRPNLFLTLTLFAAILSTCASTVSTPQHWTLPLSASWKIQYTDALDTSLPVDIYNLDLYATSPETIAELHVCGLKVIRYFSAGFFEDWRPYAGDFPVSVLGDDLEGWPGENGSTSATCKSSLRSCWNASTWPRKNAATV